MTRPQPGALLPGSPCVCYCMCMATLTRRLQILLDDDRMDRLEGLADDRGTSVAALIRQAIDAIYPDQASSRRRAADDLLAAEPMPVDGWATMKQERASMLDRD